MSFLFQTPPFPSSLIAHAPITSYERKDRVNASIWQHNNLSDSWTCRQFMQSPEHLREANAFNRETYSTNVPIHTHHKIPPAPASDLEIMYKEMLQAQIAGVAPVIHYWPGRRF